MIPGWDRGQAQRLKRWLSPRQRRLERLRAEWGRPGTKDSWLESRYFELTRTPGDPRQVDDRTWKDLEFPRIFATLDTTVTRIGSQSLFARLRTYWDDPGEAAAWHDGAETLRRDQRLREEIQLRLSPLAADSYATLAESLYGAPLGNFRHPAAIIAWCGVSIAVLVAIGALSLTPLAVLPLLTVNLFIVTRLSAPASELVDSLRGCQTLLRVADKLARIRTAAEVPQLATLATSKDLRTRVRRALHWLALFQRLREPLGIDVWLNFLCLAEYVADIRTRRAFLKRLPELRVLYEAVGSLDAATALASFLERSPTRCTPIVTHGSSIEIEGGRHPLLARQTPNSLTLHGRSVLVSGSNMAGKTTFIKMVATNVILGRTLGVCLADRAVIPRASVMASIRGEHSVESGKSRYFAELEALLEFLGRARQGEPLVLAIDEPFGGTNTRERVAAATAVLAALSRGALVLATTHDVELHELLRGRFDLYHFREDPQVEGYFDFRLRPGACTEGNALRLLAKIGFPHAVVAEALAVLGEAQAPEEKRRDNPAGGRSA